MTYTWGVYNGPLPFPLKPLRLPSRPRDLVRVLALLRAMPPEARRATPEQRAELLALIDTTPEAEIR